MVSLYFFQIARGEGGDGLPRKEVLLLRSKLKETAQIHRVGVAREHGCLAVDRAKKRSAKHGKLGDQRADLERIIFVECGMVRVCHQKRLEIM